MAQSPVNHTVDELNEKLSELSGKIRNDYNRTLKQQIVSAIIPGRGDQPVQVPVDIVQLQAGNIAKQYQYGISNPAAQQTVNNLYDGLQNCINKANELGINGGRRRQTKRRQSKRRGTKRRRNTMRRRSSRK
jgi:hypothetical protein